MRAAIIGRAWRTPLGRTIDDVIRRLLAGERAARDNLRFDASAYACRVAATTNDPGPSPHRRFLRRMGLLALEVAAEAAPKDMNGDRLGLFFGYGGLRAHWEEMMPALEHQTPDGADAWERGLKLLHPFWMLQHLSNNAHAIAAQELGARGEGVTFGGASAGAQAISSAIRALEAHAVDAALVVAHDGLVEPETLIALAARRAVTERSAEDSPAPYDRDAAGCVPGEAAAALLLVRDDDRRALAYLEAADGADGEEGEPRAGTISTLLEPLIRGGETIDGAGRARADLDREERIAIAALTGTDATLSSCASAFGQVGAALPLLQAIAMTELLRRNVLAPIAFLRHPADGPLRPLIQAEQTNDRAAIGVSTGAPGLAGAIRVELP